MGRIAIHIGLGKTGSSSVQAFLSHHFADDQESPFQYCAMEADGKILTGKALKDRARTLAFGYAASTDKLTEPGFDAARAARGLRAIFEAGKTPILSQESWSHSGHLFHRSGVFERLGFEFEIIVFVRPQVDYLNAAWWQWWKWDPRFDSPKSLVDNIAGNWEESVFAWARQIEDWTAIPQCKKVAVRLHGSDTVADFLSVLGIEGHDTTEFRMNNGQGEILIKLYETVPGLRDVHGSEIDSLLTPLLKDDRRAPWAVDEDSAARMIEGSRDGNKRLIKMLDFDLAKAMDEDERWWTIEAYRNKFPPPPLPAMSRDDARKILQDVIPELLRLRRKEIAEMNRPSWPQRILGRLVDA